MSLPCEKVVEGVISLSEIMPASPANQRPYRPRVTKKYKTETRIILFVAAKKSAVASITAIAVSICFLMQQRIKG
jgi:hypothetical protein